MSNPLVAERKDSTQGFSGVPLLESVNDTSKAIESGDWAAGVLGAAGTALDALGMALDPFGAIFSAGVGWLIEHVGPLSDALDELTGDPDQIKAHAQTWTNIAGELGSISTEMANLIASDTASWTGESADAYRARSTDTANLIGAAKAAAEGAASGIGTAGEVVAAVRTLVRDIIAELVGHLISWALQVLFTLGIGMVWVVPQVIGAVAKTATKIAGLTTKLVQALGKLAPMLKKLGGAFGDVSKSLKNVKPGKAAPPSPKPGDPTPTPKGLDLPKSGDGTSPSSTGPTPKPDTSPPPRPDTNGSPNPPGSNNDIPTPTPKGNGPNGSTTPSGSPPTNKPDKPRDTAVGPDTRVCKSDPVDVATGEMILTQRDLELPGALRLVLDRTHVSSYRAGHWFGPSWSSTVDQRLEVDDQNVCYFGDDGMILVYPIPAAGASVLPLEGPRWPLRAEPTGTYAIAAGKRDLRFAAPSGPRRRVHPLSVTESSDGDRVEIEYDGVGAPVLMRHSSGYQVSVRTESGRVAGIAVSGDGTGEVVVMRYRYDDRGRLTEVINSSGAPLRFDYDDSGRITGWQDRNSVWYRYVFDAEGRCVRTVGDGGFLDGTFVYDRQRMVTIHTDSLGHSTEFHLNGENQVLQEIDPLHNVTTFEWDRYDRLLSRADPLGRVTRHEYSADGTLSAIVRPDGSRVRVDQHDDDALAVSVHDKDQTWRHSYAGTEAPDPMAAQVGVAMPLRYDSIQAKDPAAEPGTRFERDMFGRPSRMTTAAGGQTHLSWTVEGRLASRISPSGGREQWRYDNEGNEIEHLDALGQRTRTEYGPFDRPIATTDAVGARTTYSYDTELRLIAVTNPHGLVWRFTYDAAGRLIEETDFDGRILRFTYDAAGQLRTSANMLGEITEFTYDLLGQVIERRSPSGTTSYRYDPLGRLASAVGPDAELVFQRDEDGRVITESVNGRTVTFSYSDDGREKRRRTPSGVDSLWTFDGAGTPQTLSTAGHVLQFTHDQGGRETQRVVDGTVVLTQSFDSEYRLASQMVADVQRRFDYRQDGKLIGLQDKVSGSVRLVLDPSGRITEVIAPDRRENYRYDATGNITASRLGPHQYQGNTLTAAGGVTFGHDPHGRMVLRRQGPAGSTEQTWLYTWDTHDRMTGVITPDGQRWRYLYDPLGRRIAKQRLVPGAEPAVAEQIEFTWDGPLLIEQVHTDAAGRRLVTTWDYHPTDDRPLTQTSSDGRFVSIVTDQVGTPTGLVDTAGKLVWHNRSSLWGEVLGTPGTPLRFPGQYADPETRLYYNVYRYYDPAVGRYISQDPYGLGPAPNPFAYVGNPHLSADPLGLMDCGGGNSGNTPGRPGAGNDPANVKKTPPPPPKKPGGLKTWPPVPDKAPNRNGAKTFGKDTAGNEKYELSEDGTKVKIYRFGDQSKPYDWESKSRWNNDHNDFTQPDDLNSWAIKQSSFGSGSEGANKNPFISIATDPGSLAKSNDPWVQKIVKESPDVRVMEVPAELLVRPRPTKPISKEETEWLFYDGDYKMSDFHKEWQPNPFKGK
ncbi:RHS repeat-associated protein [Kibdelosporangium banguiense]|uniref:RHS repeat-associated protein n=1 Tax=Kibdelosporangium banguiense TaxID=1365924 RepID=A0ABS4U2Y8_9PSEU|nr:DUF6531 domain-containing protein [Kibdelosporangium banguiense]MBP2330551.1 RHS repeat-associated protein [Kibdelosporangium banguiense]